MKDRVKAMLQDKQFFCHKLVMETARGIAGAHYEMLMSSNQWYSSWKATHPELSGEALQRRYIEDAWGRYIGEARHTLAGMLRQPIAEDLKEQIHEALVLDAGVPRPGPRRPLFRI